MKNINANVFGISRDQFFVALDKLDNEGLVNGIKFADYGECDEGMHLTEKERLDYLNENCRL